MILVVGATGVLGSEICLMLAKGGETVRALVRKTSAPGRTETLTAAGIELFVGDLKDPASLIDACKGVDAIISTASSTFSRQEGDSIQTVDDGGQLNLVEAAEAAGVLRFIFVSFPHPEGLSSPLSDAKLRVEEAIKRFNFTVIQASYFMEWFLTPALGFDYANGSARIYGSGNSPSSLVSLKDVAKICVLAVSHPSAERRVIEFGGPEALTPLQVIEKFEELTGKAFRVGNVPEAEILAQYETAKDSMQKTFAALILGYARGRAIDMKAVQEEFGLTLTSVDEYAREVTGSPLF
jgi:uncharacterized protein YbjT (DUF2867 family)